MFQLGPHPPTFKPTSPTCYGRACRRQLWDWIQIANHWIILDHGRKVWNTTCHVQSVIRWGVELEKHGQYFGSCKSCTAKAPRRISEEITHSWNSKHKQQNVSKCWMKHKQDKNGDNSEKKYRKNITAISTKRCTCLKSFDSRLPTWVSWVGQKQQLKAAESSSLAPSCPNWQDQRQKPEEGFGETLRIRRYTGLTM